MILFSLNILLPLLLSLVAGFFIGLERTIHGHSAGMRTHMLVCLASSLLMVITVHQLDILPNIPLDAIRIDPTRMVQGIMTGIGFLGAGVIIKEGLTIRGLTTAASIWTTSTIGVLIGIGFYAVGIVATFLTLCILVIFRWVERKTPTLHYATLAMTTRTFITKENMAVIFKPFNIEMCSGIEYTLDKNNKTNPTAPITYRVVVRTKTPFQYEKLLSFLIKDKRWSKVELTPANDG